MIALLLVPLAGATTLKEVVDRAAEVNPDALVAGLEWRQDKLAAAEAWTALGPTVSADVGRSATGDVVTTSDSLTVSVGLLDAGQWFGAGGESAKARASGHAYDATTLDAQYFAAMLYYEALSAQAALDAAKQGAALAKATLDATRARVGAGLESELVGRSAEIGQLQAEAEVASAEAGVNVARARLARAVEQDIGELAPADVPVLPTGEGASPWLQEAEAQVSAARWEHGTALAELLPEGGAKAATGLFDPGVWTVTLSATWTFDGLAGPFLRERRAALETRIAETELDALRRDLDLASTEAVENARAASRIAEVARARERLSEESLRVGQTRLGVGLASSLEVLRLQDEAAQARADRVSAELAESISALEARRVAGISWD